MRHHGVPSKNESAWTLLFAVLTIAIGIGVMLGWNACTYGDAMCAFKHCVDVKGTAEKK